MNKPFTAIIAFPGCGTPEEAAAEAIRTATLLAEGYSHAKGHPAPVVSLPAPTGPESAEMTSLRLTLALRTSYDLTENLDASLEDRPDIIQKCLDEGRLFPVWDLLEESVAEVRAEVVFEALCEAAEKSGLTAEDVMRLRTLDPARYDDACSEVEERDTGRPAAQAWDSTRIALRMELLSNYDCWIPPYDTCGIHHYRGTAMRMMLKMLSLNPAKMKAALEQYRPCAGCWPDIKSRDGGELVDYDAFAAVLEDCPNYGLLTFFGTADMKALREGLLGEGRPLVVPKGTEVRIFNNWNGGGSCQACRTLRDVTLDELRSREGGEYDRLLILVDEKGAGNGYSFAEVYGRDDKKPLFKAYET